MNSKPPKSRNSDPTTLAVIVPSRGLMFSRTLEELLGELKGFDSKIYWAHGKSLPDCFNEPVERALADDDVYAVLLVEDDMIIPPGILKAMFRRNYPVMALDYPFKADGDSTMLHAPDGSAIYSGTGFMLIATPILEALPRPIFRTDTAWDMFVKGNTLMLWPRKLTKVAYGLHDVNLGVILFSNNVPIHALMRNAGQRKLIKLGEAGTNKGAHQIKDLTNVGRDMVIKTLTPEAIYKYRQALTRIQTVEVLDHIPEFIEYVDGQAQVIGLSNVSIV